MRIQTAAAAWLAALACVGAGAAAASTMSRVAAARADCVPADTLGDFKWERSGTHDAANIRTIFWNFGMVGDFPRDPLGVDLTTFHSCEAPKGSGMNYSDGITPFVLAKVRAEGRDQVIMETGYRERQAPSSRPGELMMRFEPRRGYFQEDPRINTALSPAISNDNRTWPPSWPDRVCDPADKGWKGAWNGYFGKRPAADQESFTVMDDQYYDSFGFQPDSTNLVRQGLGLRVEVRGFQWANPQAGNVIFWHYDITNEGTTNYDDNVVFGLYNDSGVGGSAFSYCDGVAESDDDNAFFDKSLGLNLVYTWDKNGHGVDLASNCSPTGYMGYAYLETPGNPFNHIDDDKDGVTDEKRDGDAGERIVGQDAIMAYAVANYDTSRFQKAYGPITNRPAYKVGVWWTGDEDMDWVEEFDDTGGDGVFGSANPAADGERDGRPTQGEPHFGRTDVDESDQIGLTGFRFNRIKAGVGAPSDQVDGILFFDDGLTHWPQRLYDQFTAADSSTRFDAALVQNYNIAFLFASGPFQLPAGDRERFSLALAFGTDLAELRENVHVVQKIYDANYQFAVPPPRPTVHAEAGDGRVRLWWDDVAERAFDPVSSQNDFEGYRIYRSTDPEFRDPRTLTTGRGNPLGGNGKPIIQFDLEDGIRGYSRTMVDGVAYWLGAETGITHTWTDTTAVNGQEYYYAVCSYDYGSPPDVPDSLAFYPSENSIPVSRTPRGGVLRPTNVVVARAEPRPPGYQSGSAGDVMRLTGKGDGTVGVQVVQSDSVPAGHVLKLAFLAGAADSIHAEAYALIDSTARDTLLKTGTVFDGRPVGPVAAGLLAIVETPPGVEVDAAHTGWRPGAHTDVTIQAKYVGEYKSPNRRRPGYPADLRIVFADTIVTTSRFIIPNVAYPVKFRVYAKLDSGWTPVPFAFSDSTTRDNRGRPVPNGAGDSTLASVDDKLLILDLENASPTALDYTYQVAVDRFPHVKPGKGDTLDIHLLVPFGPSDAFVFHTQGASIDAAQARADFAGKPYVVPNPYVGAATFEPARFAVSGRGERRLEFRNIPASSVVRIYTVHGDLVQTLRQDSAQQGMVPWDLRTKDNLEVAPGLYVYHVSAQGVGEYVGKFAIVK